MPCIISLVKFATGIFVEFFENFLYTYIFVTYTLKYQFI